MKKIVSIITIIAALSIPAVAYASQSVNNNESLNKVQQISRSSIAEDHDYRQPVWLDSSNNGHYYEPQLWL
jgi:predicted aspartyl protease